MPSFMPDSSVIVSKLSTWHGDHARARRDLEARLGRGESMIVAGRALVEAYSVLTRLPPPHRASPAVVRQAIEQSFIDGYRIVSVPAESYRPLIREAAESGVAGGRAHDAEIAYCAIEAEVDAFLTFNERHFVSFPRLAARVVVPA